MYFRSERGGSRQRSHALLAGCLAAALVTPLLAAPSQAAVRPAPAAPAHVVYDALPLAGGAHARVLSNGVAQIISADRKKVQYRAIAVTPRTDDLAGSGGLPDKVRLTRQLEQNTSQRFKPNVVVVVFSAGSAPAAESRDVPATALAARDSSPASALRTNVPAYTNDAQINAALLALGTDRIERLFRGYDRAALAALRTRAESSLKHRLLPIENTYRLHIVGSSVTAAVRRLVALPNVLYAEPDYTVTPMNVPGIDVPSGRGSGGTLAPRPQTQRQNAAATTLPSNYALQTSFQSLLNAPALNAAAAYDEIERTYHQLPGTGEIITNVSIGDVDDLSNTKDPCYNSAQAYGPTTRVIGSQRYIDWPSMPLIAAYVSNISGQITPNSVCNVDPGLGEVGLDFSMMAPLPHAAQRAGAVGTGRTDLLGIAPGATFRLVVPGSLTDVGNTDINAAFLAAATQNPRPNVITASLGFGYDQFGYPSRYLEDDPLGQAIVAMIVQNYNIVVCISSGDGLRTFTNADVSPTGGSEPTNTIAPGQTPTTLSDIANSSDPSRDFDSGSIDVGGTTLDDIFAAPPQYNPNPVVKSDHVYAETRWTGFTNFSSGFGTRVNVSAPADNVISFSHVFGGAYNAVAINIEGGTSASAPLVAASAAVALQVARLTGQPFTTPLAVRSFLAATGRPVAPVPQADRPLNVGPQIDLGSLVESLLQRAGRAVKPTVARVAVEQRRDAGNLDGAFLSDTDASAIDLQGPISALDQTPSGRNELAWITIAPDWEALPAGTTFSLHLTSNTGRVLATTSYARLLPAEILNAVGQPLQSGSARTVNLTYTATLGKGAGAGKTLAIPVSLVFGPADSTSRQVLAPQVAPVITGPTVAVTYDITRARNVVTPVLQVSAPGRVDPATGTIYHPQYQVPLYALKGTVHVPVVALAGGGIYGIGIAYGNIMGSPLYSDFAFTRVAPTSAARPAAPLLSTATGIPGAHYLEIAYGATASVAWDVSGVPGATGAAIEVAGAGPTPFGSYQGFNNDNGTQRDKNGIDSGSVAYIPVAGTSGTRAFSASQLGLVPTLYHTIRVVPTNGSTVVGEAGDYSTIQEDGVFATDGGFASNGFGVNANGSDGFITSSQATATGAFLSSIESFDQRTNHITHALTTTPSVPLTFGWGIYGDDIGLVGELSTTTFTDTYNLLAPVASLTPGGAAFTPPAGLAIVEAAANAANDDAAFEAYDPAGKGNDLFRAFTHNLKTNAPGPVYDISAPLLKYTAPSILGFGEDTTLDIGIAAAGDFNAFCGQPLIEGVNLKTGATASITGVGSGLPFGLAIDSTTDTIAVPTVCDSTVGLYSIKSRTTAYSSLPGGGNGFYSAADPVHHQFLVEQTVSPDFSYNNNSLSTVYSLDENGNVLGAAERFNLYGSFLAINANNLQLNPSTKTGYLLGYGSQQLEPFVY